MMTSELTVQIMGRSYSLSQRLERLSRVIAKSVSQSPYQHPASQCLLQGTLPSVIQGCNHGD